MALDDVTERPAALILDYTGVITVPLSFARSKTLAEHDIATDDGSPAERLRLMMRRELDNPDPNGLWNRLERGEAPLSDLLEQIEAVAPGAGVFFASDQPTSIMASMTVRVDVIERLRRWKSAGTRLALLTNNVAEWRPLWTAKLSAAAGDDLFDVIIDSSAVGMRKPESRVYHHAVAVVGVPMDRCVFVDDFAQNVHGAHAVGLRALLATDDDAHWHTLDRILD
jgi:putative hydrolase of the HAD superfamily